MINLTKGVQASHRTPGAKNFQLNKNNYQSRQIVNPRFHDHWKPGASQFLTRVIERHRRDLKSAQGTTTVASAKVVNAPGKLSMVNI